jgi:hypothetical protein
MDEYEQKQYENIISILVDALRFYSDSSNYTEGVKDKKPMVLIDNGDYAKMVLGIKRDIERELKLATLDYDNFMNNITSGSEISDLDDIKMLIN